MSRLFACKTYGRPPKNDAASKAFDEVMFGKPGAPRTSSTIQRWGKTSFTSTRTSAAESEADSRKRHFDDTDTNSLDDPFAFDSEDKGPPKPKRGMGFKVKVANERSSNKNLDAQRGIMMEKSGNRKGAIEEKSVSNGKIVPAKTSTSSWTIAVSSINSSIQPCASSLPSEPVNAKTNLDICKSNLNINNGKVVPESTISATGISSKITLTISNSSLVKAMASASVSESETIQAIPKVSHSSIYTNNGMSTSDDIVSATSSRTTTVSDNNLLPARTSSVQREYGTVKASQTIVASSRIAAVPSSSFLPASKSSMTQPVSSSCATSQIISSRETTAPRPAVRRLLSSSFMKSTKSKAVYNHRQWTSDEKDDIDEGLFSQSQGDEDMLDEETTNVGATKRVASNVYDLDDDEPVKSPTFVHRVVVPSSASGSSDVTNKINVAARHKGLFKVVRNVKQAHECQEYGETQEFKDDIEYILDGLHDTQPTSTRCLSTASLANKCTTPAFRMHLRAQHNILTKVFSALNDAPNNPTLALCTAAIFFMLSRDRLTLDLDEVSLRLMLRLLGVDDPLCGTVYEIDSEGGSGVGASSSASLRDHAQIRQRIHEICRSFYVHGKVQNINLQLADVTAGHLAMEALLRLTSKRDGEWFKEELRKLGGLDHIVDTTCQCASRLDVSAVTLTDVMTDNLTKIDHCFRVLENVTYLNSANQNHLIKYQSAALISCAHRCLQVSLRCLRYNPITSTGDKADKTCPGYIALSCTLSALKVLLNLTHDNECGCDVIGSIDGFISSVLSCLFTLPRLLPATEQFDLIILCLSLLVNLIEHCRTNLKVLLTTSTTLPPDQFPLTTAGCPVNALEALAMLFSVRYEAAKLIEEAHDAELDARDRQRRHDGGSSKSLHPPGSLQELMGVDDLGVGGGHDASGVWQETESGIQWIATIGSSNDSTPVKKRDVNDSDDCDSAVGGGDMQMLNMGGAGSQTDEETFTKALHTAGKHMEDSLVAAYVALLVGTAIQHNSNLAEDVRDSLPEYSFDSMRRMLRKFLGFMNFTLMAVEFVRVTNKQSTDSA